MLDPEPALEGVFIPDGPFIAGVVPVLGVPDSFAPALPLAPVVLGACTPALPLEFGFGPAVAPVSALSTLALSPEQLQRHEVIEFTPMNRTVLKRIMLCLRSLKGRFERDGNSICEFLGRAVRSILACAAPVFLNERRAQYPFRHSRALNRTCDDCVNGRAIVHPLRYQLVALGRWRRAIC